MMMMMMMSIVAGGYAGCIAPPKGHATEPASTTASSGMVDAEAGEGRVCSNSRVALPATPGDFNNSATFPAMITEDEQWFDYCAWSCPRPPPKKKQKNRKTKTPVDASFPPCDFTIVGAGGVRHTAD